MGEHRAAHTPLPRSPGLVRVGAREEGWRLLAGHSHIRSGAQSYSVTSGRGPALPAPPPGPCPLGAMSPGVPLRRAAPWPFPCGDPRIRAFGLTSAAEAVRLAAVRLFTAWRRLPGRSCPLPPPGLRPRGPAGVCGLRLPVLLPGPVLLRSRCGLRLCCLFGRSPGVHRLQPQQVAARHSASSQWTPMSRSSRCARPLCSRAGFS